MTHQEILEKAIEKAIENGWKPKHEYRITLKTSTGESTIEAKANYDIIYNHDFAKALWGESDSKKCTCKKMGCTCGAIFPGDYKFHLQEMVIADDPIEYLGDNI